jgi:glycosyltransferase involved in cell wall biosynthesis
MNHFASSDPPFIRATPAAPLVSVVVPYYDQPGYLVECVRSILAQSLGDLEVIVVDDASPAPAAAQLLADAAVRDERVRVVRQPQNRGLGAARNTGFREARADLVLPVDADDLLAPEFLERTVAVLAEDERADCAYADFAVFGLQEFVRTLPVRPVEDLLRQQWIPGPGVLMRRRLWSDVGGYTEVRTLTGEEDWDFWLGALERGFTPRRIPLPLYRYRTHGESMTSTTLSYRADETTELMYRRHQRLFSAYGAGRAFRAAGLRRSAIASVQRGERGRGLRLALRSVGLAPASVQALLRTVAALAVTAAANRVRRRSAAR